MAKSKVSRKVFATTASAALVASAVVPAAVSAAELKDMDKVGDWAKEAVQYLADKGYLQGDQNNNFNPNDNIDRASAAEVLRKALNLSTEGTEDFVDVKEGDWFYESVVAVSPEIFEGNDKDQFLPKKNLTRQEAAIAIVKAYGLTGEDDLSSFVDADKVASWAKDAVKTAVAAGILTGKPGNKVAPTDNISRAEFAVMVKRAIDQQDLSVSAVNSKTLEVKFNTAVDTDKVEISVKKGTVTTNVAKVSFADDKKSATLELSAKLTEGEYTVTVTGLPGGDLTATYKAENEHVESIEILSDKAILNVAGDEVSVGYKVYNQYKEDITRTTTLTETASRGTANAQPADSKVVIGSFGAVDPKVGDKITLSLVHAETGESVVKTLEVSNTAVVDSVEVEGLYVEDERTLTADETDVNEFMLLVNLEDQYGNVIGEAAAERDLLVTVSNPNVVTVNGLNTANNSANFDTVEIDGKERTVLRLDGGLQAGKSTIRLISKNNGASATYEVEVKEGLKTNTVTLSQPEFAVADETVTIPFSATDMYGEELKNISILSKAASAGGVDFSVSGAGATAANKPQFVVDANGNTQLRMSLAGLSKGSVVVTATTANQQFTTLTFNVREAAKPVAITGLSSNVYRNVLEGESLTINTTHLIAEDQYGRTQNGSWLNARLGATDSTNAGDLRVAVRDANTSGGAISVPASSALGSATSTSLSVDGDERGTENLIFVLEEYKDGQWKEVAGSQYNQQLRTVLLSDVESYEVNDIGTLYDDNAGTSGADANIAEYNHAVKVNGVLSNGSKVFIPHTTTGSDVLYNVTTNNPALAIAGNVIDVDTDANGTLSYGNSNEVTQRVTVTINHTGDAFVKDVVVSKAKPRVELVEFDIYMTGVSALNDDMFNVALASTAVDSAEDHFNLLYIEDQYGAEFANIDANGLVTFADGSSTSVSPYVTFSNVQNISGGNAPTISNNGTKGASISGLSAGDIFVSTITFANGKTTSARVVVTQ